jgi:hypothetical protein
VHTIAKITPAAYPDLLAAVAAGISQRELARRYDCAPSLVARQVARATRARELSDRTEEPDLVLTAEPHTGSLREILEARIRDPKTSARDLSSLVNSLAKLDEEGEAAERPSSDEEPDAQPDYDALRERHPEAAVSFHAVRLAEAFRACRAAGIEEPSLTPLADALATLGLL